MNKNESSKRNESLNKNESSKRNESLNKNESSNRNELFNKSESFKRNVRWAANRELKRSSQSSKPNECDVKRMDQAGNFAKSSNYGTDYGTGKKSAQKFSSYVIPKKGANGRGEMASEKADVGNSGFGSGNRSPRDQSNGNKDFGVKLNQAQDSNNKKVPRRVVLIDPTDSVGTTKSSSGATTQGVKNLTGKETKLKSQSCTSLTSKSCTIPNTKQLSVDRQSPVNHCKSISNKTADRPKDSSCGGLVSGPATEPSPGSPRALVSTAGVAGRQDAVKCISVPRSRKEKMQLDMLFRAHARAQFARSRIETIAHASDEHCTEDEITDHEVISVDMISASPITAPLCSEDNSVGLVCQTHQTHKHL